MGIATQFLLPKADPAFCSSWKSSLAIVTNVELKYTFIPQSDNYWLADKLNTMRPSHPGRGRNQHSLVSVYIPEMGFLFLSLGPQSELLCENRWSVWSANMESHLKLPWTEVPPDMKRSIAVTVKPCDPLSLSFSAQYITAIQSDGMAF